LQDRLWEWTSQQQKQHQARLTEDRRGFGGMESDVRTSPATTRPGRNDENQKTVKRDNMPSSSSAGATTDTPTSPNSLAEWVRTVDLEPLLQRREEIHREKRQGRPKQQRAPPRYGGNSPTTSTKEYLTKLTEAIRAPSSPYSSNFEVKELYIASKQADQLGERGVAKELLETLVKLTPNDARIYRRLARMNAEEGKVSTARAILQQGIRLLPDNGFLWHGLGQLEFTEGQEFKAREFFQKAIAVDPSLPHSYHSLGTMLHTQGRISLATKVLKRGIEYCPTNNRLHHALGDLYRGAKLLADAERSYRRALEHGPEVSHCFAYSALAYVAYEKFDIDECRSWLRKSVALNDGRHAQGWVSLAQMEESEGNVDAARSVCIAAITQYERGLIEMNQRYKKRFQKKDYMAQEQKPLVVPEHNATLSLSSDPLTLKNELLRSVPRYRSGDRFLKLYRSWATLEERHGSFDTVEEVYTRASIAFPYESKLTLDWAKYHSSMRNRDRARVLFMEACTKAANRYVRE
jgi:tetratricopeptide (TPR) repeat protein